MPRQPRFVVPGYPQHVIVRGNNRIPIFQSPDDFRYFRSKLHESCEAYDCELHAYVLMTNHTHFLITPRGEFGIGRAIQKVGRHYVQYFNKKYQRTGTLWEGRYKATLVDTESYLLTCYRYIELNPVRAALVGQPAEYPWSSYHHNALGKPDRLITEHSLYAHLGKCLVSRSAAYRAFFDEEIPTETLETIRDATNKEWMLADEDAIKRRGHHFNRRVAPQARGGNRKLKNDS